jgi:hypothetical protein
VACGFFGDRPTGAQIARHLENVFAALPEGVETMYFLVFRKAA